MKSKNSGNDSSLSDKQEFDELIETLGMFHKNAMTVLDESRYVHLYDLAQACIKHLTAMKNRIAELEATDANTRH